VLLVFPGGADLPFCRELNGEGNRRIDHYIRQLGGRYLGFCAGGYYGAKTVEFEIGSRQMEVRGQRELAFFNGVARGSVYPGFVYGSDTCAVAANIVSSLPENTIQNEQKDAQFSVYVNGGCLFVDADEHDDIEVLARYSDKLAVAGTDLAGKSARTEDVRLLPAAAIYTRAGEGQAVLTGIHPEFSPDLLHAPAPNTPYAATIAQLKRDNAQRVAFLSGVLRRLGLKVNKPNPAGQVFPVRPSRMMLSALCIERLPYVLEELLASIGDPSSQTIRGTTNQFVLSDASLGGLFQTEQTRNKTQVQVDVYYSSLPEVKHTPNFNHELYYNSLRSFYADGRLAEDLGSFLLYGEVVSSTSSLLLDNGNLLSRLPNGFSVVGGIQLAGRGRGSNVWVNPPGVLAVSSVLRFSSNDFAVTCAPSTNIVFVQYLVTLAMVEAVRTYGDLGYGAMPVRIKWPNDIYVEIPTEEGELQLLKIGGALITNNVFGADDIVVAGVGINVANTSGPSTSLNAVLSILNAQRRRSLNLSPLEPYTTEKLLARYFVILQRMLTEFRYQGFKPFELLYYRRWLHTGKKVQFCDANGERVPVRIKGISSISGMLVAEEELDADKEYAPQFGASWSRPKRKYELLPDGNSFDLFEGLIKVKDI
jgi:biotin--protein ligase